MSLNDHQVRDSLFPALRPIVVLFMWFCALGELRNKLKHSRWVSTEPGGRQCISFYALTKLRDVKRHALGLHRAFCQTALSASMHSPS